LEKGPLHMHTPAVYMFSPDIDQCLEKTGIQHATDACLDTHPQCTHVTQMCFQV
jgi:hypothetical protein